MLFFRISNFRLTGIIALLFFSACSGSKQVSILPKIARIDTTEIHQTIEGFGVNINPSQWCGGLQKPVIDRLIDELGCTFFRFDIYGNSCWLDADKLPVNSHFPYPYLDSIYRTPVFTQSWDMLRYLNQRQVTPFLSVSGVVPQAWMDADGRMLSNYNAFGELQASLFWWARTHENCKLTIHAPFNENDYGGTVEGPGINPEDKVQAFQGVLNGFRAYCLDSVQFVVFDDATFQKSKIDDFLQTPGFEPHIKAFAAHTYGNGDEGDGDSWYYANSEIGTMNDWIATSSYSQSGLWLTEFGDLDQTGEIEYDIAWRTTRRLFRALNEGVSAALSWDAFDNYHVHDSAWLVYGLLHTDTLRWKYTPKKRFYALKQVFRFVKPGFVRVGVHDVHLNDDDPYADWKAPLKNIRLLAFYSPQTGDVTIVGMSLCPDGTRLEIEFPEEWQQSGKKLHLYQTTPTDDCKKTASFRMNAKKKTIKLAYKSIFTLTTLSE